MMVVCRFGLSAKLVKNPESLRGFFPFFCFFLTNWIETIDFEMLDVRLLYNVYWVLFQVSGCKSLISVDRFSIKKHPTPSVPHPTLTKTTQADRHSSNPEHF